MTEKSSGNTIGRFNLAQGFLLIIVIIHHTFNTFIGYGSYQIFKNMNYLSLFFLYRFFEYGVISTFFVISGIGFSPFKNWSRIGKRCHLILVPYFLVAAMVVVLNLFKKILVHSSAIQVLSGYGIPYLLGLCPGDRYVFHQYMYSIGPVWFLLSLLESSILLSAIMKIKNRTIQTILVSSAVLTGLITSYYLLLPWCFSQSFIVTGYLYFGVLMREYKLLVRKIHWYVYTVMILCVIPIMRYGEVSVSNNIWKLGFLDFTATIIIAFLLMRLYMKIASYKNIILSKIGKIGRYSLWILCIHTVEVQAFPWYTYAQRMKAWLVPAILIELILRSALIYCGFRLTKYIWKRYASVTAYIGR